MMPDWLKEVLTVRFRVAGGVQCPYIPVRRRNCKDLRISGLLAVIADKSNSFSLNRIGLLHPRNGIKIVSPPCFFKENLSKPGKGRAFSYKEK